MPHYNKLALVDINMTGVEFADEVEDYTTAGLVQFCLRNGCTDAEYHLALRAQKLREIALEMATEIIEEGGEVKEDYLRLIDVHADVATRKRLYTNG
jgi:hypothetical protein